MRFRTLTRCFTVAAVVACLALISAAPPPPSPAANGVKNIVLVHGAFVDGSGWKPVYEILIKDGYHVALVQEPLTSLEEDVAATNRVLELQNGPCVLVAHSYGGTVITEAGTHAKVAALVYIAAHQPDVGETEAGNGKRFPALTCRPSRLSSWHDRRCSPRRRCSRRPCKTPRGRPSQVGPWWRWPTGSSTPT